MTSSALLLRRRFQRLEEQLADGANDKAEQVLQAYESLDLHPEIARASSDLYRDGRYAHAIEDAVKALNNLVRLRSSPTFPTGALILEFCRRKLNLFKGR
jgi:hypothetical protein